MHETMPGLLQLAFALNSHRLHLLNGKLNSFEFTSTSISHLKLKLHDFIDNQVTALNNEYIPMYYG